MNRRPNLQLWMWPLGTALAAVIVVWDIWTRGSVAVAVTATAAVIIFAVAGFLRARRQSRISHVPAVHDSRRAFSPMIILTGQWPALQFARAFVVGMVLFRYGFAPNEPLFVDAILAAMVSGVSVLMFAILMPAPSNKN